jgi:hypothetical protein
VGVIVADGAVACSPVRTDKGGNALPMTKSPFCVVSAATAHGKDLVDLFETHWLRAKPLT